jgi:hypothetical protein
MVELIPYKNERPFALETRFADKRPFLELTS